MNAAATAVRAEFPARILIVDDNLQNLELAARLLGGAGFETVTAQGGYQGLFVLSSETVDAVLLDLMMPEIDGFEVCREIRGELKLDLLPIVMLTGSNSESHIVEAFAAGATDYCTKPMKKAEVVARLNAAISQSRAAQALRELQRTLEQRVRERTEQLDKAARELERKNTFLSSVLDTAVSGIITISERGIVESFNRAAETIFGYAAGEVIGQNIAMLMPEPDRTRHDDYLRSYIDTGHARIISVGREVVAQRKDGGLVRIDLAVSEMRFDGRRLFTGIVNDVSLRHSMEEALGQAQQRLLLQNHALTQFGQLLDPTRIEFRVALREFAQLCSDATDADAVDILLRRDGTDQFCVESHLGSASPDSGACGTVRMSDLYGHPVITYPLDANSVADQHVSSGSGPMIVLDAGVMVDASIRGVVRCVRSARQPWHLDEQNFVAFLASQVALLVESHLRAQVQQRLKANEARLRNAQRIARLGDWEWNPTSGTFFASRGLRAIVSPYERDSLRTVDEFLDRVHPDDRARLRAAIESCRANALPFSLDFRILSNNEELYLQGRGELADRDNAGPKIACAVVDVTARKRAELALKEMTDHLQEKVDEQTRDLIVARDAALAGERAMSTFLANMSHEIRTPLHAILSYARFGLKGGDSQDADAIKGHFGVIRDSGEELLGLLNDLLDLSKLRAGRMAYDFSAVSLEKLCQEVLDKFSPLLAEHGQAGLVVRKGSDRPVEADERKLAQVLRNVLSNAVKFSPRQSTIQIIVDCEDGEVARIAVRDRGEGVPEHELQTIFDPFTQSSKTASKGGGTGLGLAICKEIIEVGHRGRIWASNNPDGGATITFILPYEAG